MEFPNLNFTHDDLMAASDPILDSDEDILDLANIPKMADNVDEEVKRLEKVLTDKGIEGIRKELSTNLQKWKGIGLQIAVTGTSGAGKSAFINAIRDVLAEDKGGAKVGVTETTAFLKSYKHPKNPNFIVWDMPGVGTPNFPKEDYLTRVGFDRYDFFMIVSKSRFTEQDLWLAKQIKERNKRFYFIRTKIDVDISSDRRANEKSHSDENVILKVYKNCYKNLVKAGIKDPLVFLVDNHDREKYAFGQIETRLLQDADCLKVEAMALSFSTLTKGVLQKKRDVLEGRIAEKAMEIACLLNDESGQRLVFENEVSTYKDQFNLDEETLSRNEDVLKFSDAHLREFQESLKTVTEQQISQLHRKSLYGRGGSFFEMTIRFLWRYLIFYFESDGSRRHSRSVLEYSCFALHQNLEKLYKMALNVYDLNAQKSCVTAAMKN